MPNGYEAEKHAVWAASRFWGFVWQTGDTIYYLGLLGSVIWPLSCVWVAVMRCEEWPCRLWALGIGAGLLLVCFPVGLCVSIVLMETARRRTGIKSEGH